MMNFKEFLELNEADAPPKLLGYDPNAPKKGFFARRFGNLFKTPEAKLADAKRARQARTAMREPIQPNNPGPTATSEELSKYQSEMKEFQKNHEDWQKRQGANERYNKKLQARQKQTGNAEGGMTSGGPAIIFYKTGDIEPSQGVPIQQAGMFIVNNALHPEDYYFVNDGRQENWAQIKDSRWLQQQATIAQHTMNMMRGGGPPPYGTY